MDVAGASILLPVLPYLMPVVLWFIAVGLWRCWVRATRDRECGLPLPPGCAGLPFVGETIHMLWKKFDFYREKRAKYGRVYMTHVLGRPTVRVWGQENLRKVLKSEGTNVTISWPKSVQKLVGPGGLILASRRLHTIRRQALAKAFTYQALDAYTPGVQSIMQKKLNEWMHGGPVDIKSSSRLFVFEVMVRMLLGFDFSDKTMMSMVGHLDQILSSFFALPIDLPGFSFRKGLKARRALLKDIDDILQTKTSSTAVNTVSIMLNPKPGEPKPTTDEIKDEIIEMLFSGYQGLSSMITTSLIELSKHPEVAHKLLEELRENKMVEGELKMEALNRLPYLKKVVTEMLRYGTPFGGGFRQVLKTFELEGYQIPKGWTVLYSIRDNHESEENFACAREFNPERWDKINAAVPNGNSHTGGVLTNNNTSEGDGTVYSSVEDYKLMTFGGPGTRSCVGAKFVVLCLQLFLCELVRSTSWSLSEPDPEMSYFPTMQPVVDLKVDFAPVGKPSAPQPLAPAAGPLPEKVPLA